MNRIREFFAKDWSFEEKVLLTAAAFLAGLATGLLLSPFRSISMGNNCANTYGTKEEGEEEEK